MYNHINVIKTALICYESTKVVSCRQVTNLMNLQPISASMWSARLHRMLSASGEHCSHVLRRIGFR